MTNAVPVDGHPFDGKTLLTASKRLPTAGKTLRNDGKTLPTDGKRFPLQDAGSSREGVG